MSPLNFEEKAIQNNHWNLPPKFKFYEALGVLADSRLEIIQRQEDGLFGSESSNFIEAKSYSSSRNKFYIIKYDPANNQIMTNDNLTWYKDLLGYPALSLLCFLDILHFDKSIIPAFADIAWKDINQKYKNDYAKVEAEVDSNIKNSGFDLVFIKSEIDSLFTQLTNLKLTKLGPKIKPPIGY